MKQASLSPSGAHLPSAQIGRLVRSAAIASVVVAVILIVAKALAWWSGGAVSMLASLADSLMDSLASVLNLLVVRYALQPADTEHRFGHGKAEFLAGLGQALLIGGSAVFLVYQGIDRLLNPAPLAAVGLSVGIMLFSIMATLALLVWQRHVVAVTHSVAIKADALHYASDLLSNAGVIVALGLSWLGWPFFDPVFAIVIAFMIGYGAIRIATESIDQLLDRELPATVEKEIRSLALGFAGVLGVHAVRTRQSGTTKVIQMHLEMDGDMTLKSAHELADQVENALRQAFPGADVIIHQDPYRPNRVVS
jgi:ferrous-iron efflux pump FieF